MIPAPGRRAPRRSASRRRLAVGLVGVLAAVASVACGGSEESGGTGGADSLAGYTRDPAPSVAAVSLPRADGDGDVSFRAASGALRLVYFGYTSCPDVCPTTMSDLKRAVLSLPESDQGRVGFVMVTVDPDRDLPAKLDAYVTTFLPEGESARTEDDAQLRAAAAAFGADYSVTTDEAGEIEVSHTAEVYAVDDRGEVVLQWPFGTTADDIGQDLATLLERAEQV